MQIELVKIGKPTRVGNTTKLELEYIRDGKNVKRALAAYGKTKEVVQALGSGEFVSGDIVDVELEKVEKDGQTYYNWNGVTKINGAPAAAAKKSEYKSTYETPEERAEKNVRITRMACLNAAVQYSERFPKASPEDVAATAEQFVHFVMQTENMARVAKLAEKGMDSVKDDIPWDK